MQALFVAHKERSAQLPAAAQGPGRVAVRLYNYAKSALHMRQLKSKSIGGWMEEGGCMACTHQICRLTHANEYTSRRTRLPLHVAQGAWPRSAAPWCA